MKGTKSLKEVVRFHGHICPGLVLGYRVSELALREMGTRAEDEELIAIVENNSCAVDAVQVMTGCTFGKGNLFFHDYGKQVYTFARRGKATGIRIAVDWRPPEESPKEKELWQRYMKGERSLEVLRAVHRRKTKKIDSILRAKDTELFKIKRVRVTLPPEAKIYKSVVCASCKEKVMETRARVLEGEILCIPCFRRKDEAS